MYTLFVSKISKLLNLNQWEPQHIYEKAVCFREFGIQVPKNYMYFLTKTELPILKYVPKTLRNSTMKKKLLKYEDRCKFGTNNEALVIEHLKQNGWNIEGQQKLVKFQINDFWQIVGKVDALREYARGMARLIEVKCRVNGFVGVRTSEMVQLQLYLLSTGLKSCLFVEACGNEVQVHTITKDDVYLRILVDAIGNLTNHLDRNRLK